MGVKRHVDEQPMTFKELGELQRLALRDVDAARRRYRVRRDEIIAAMRAARPYSTAAVSLVLKFEVRADVLEEATVARATAFDERRRILRDGGAGTAR